MLNNLLKLIAPATAVLFSIAACDEAEPLTSPEEVDESEIELAVYESDAESGPRDDGRCDPGPAGPSRKAMTWAKIGHEATHGADHLGCAGCNAYSGDTACTALLPVICIKQDGSPVPGGLYVDFYNGWTGGHIATTPPIQGTSLTSLQVGNQRCADNFGPGWRMAEFHDGNGGWNWYAYGDVRQDTRFWVYINDQPSNCWDN